MFKSYWINRKKMRKLVKSFVIKLLGIELAGYLNRWYLYKNLYRTGRFSRFEMDKN